MNRNGQMGEFESRCEKEVLNIRDLLGTHLRQKRDNAEISQMQLSKISGVHIQTIKNIELKKSNVTIGIVIRLALALKIDLQELFKEI